MRTISCFALLTVSAFVASLAACSADTSDAEPDDVEEQVGEASEAAIGYTSYQGTSYDSSTASSGTIQLHINLMKNLSNPLYDTITVNKTVQCNVSMAPTVAWKGYASALLPAGAAKTEANLTNWMCLCQDAGNHKVFGTCL